MKLVAETGPRTWILPLIHERDGEGADSERWWESDRIVLVTSLQDGDMVHLCLYDRDDDVENEEIDADFLPLGIAARIDHKADGDDYSRVWTLERVVGLPVARVPGLTNALAGAHAWALAEGPDAS